MNPKFNMNMCVWKIAHYMALYSKPLQLIATQIGSPKGGISYYKVWQTAVDFAAATVDDAVIGSTRLKIDQIL